VRRCPRDGAILAAAGVLADPVRDSHEEVGVGAAAAAAAGLVVEAREAAPEGRLENGAAEGLGCGGAPDDGRDVVRARDDLELEIYRKWLRRRLHRRPVAAWARRAQSRALD